MGIPSADYGWRTGSGKFPPYYLDSLPPVNDLGRGSPVGVAFYQSHTYPAEYFDAFLQGDWSRGRVVLSKFKRVGATYELAEPASNFIYGEPLNVTDLAVGPDGLVYFTMGGRTTQGGFFRVAYKGYGGKHCSSPGIGGSIGRPPAPAAFRFQPRRTSRPRRTKWLMAWGEQLQALVRDDLADTSDRIQALHLPAALRPEAGCPPDPIRL